MADAAHNGSDTQPAAAAGSGSIPLRRRAARFVAFALVVVNAFVIDQIVKKAAIAQLSGTGADGAYSPGRVEIVPGFFELTYLENRGAAFGMFQDNALPLAAFSLFAFAFILWKRKELFGRSRLGAAAEALLYSGLFGNLYDRLVRTYVVDMFHFHWRDVWHFPVFNVADIYIAFAGAILVWLFIADALRGRRRRADEKA